jgi:hypothetical protein
VELGTFVWTGMSVVIMWIAIELYVVEPHAL